MALIFRSLTADEVDARVKTVTEKGVMLLLYKDARCDQRILDETVGPYNWQRHHSRDNANCIVSIWDMDKCQWIEKEDTGVESNTESEKGLASDSFKRACFNWGIGRELYTAPFIWISSENCKITTKGKGFICYDKFKVSKMEVTDGKITMLEITNTSRNMVCFRYRTNAPVEAAKHGKTEEQLNKDMIEKVNNENIDATKWKVLEGLSDRKGVAWQNVLRQYGLRRGNDMTIAQWKEACDRLQTMPDIRKEVV